MADAPFVIRPSTLSQLLGQVVWTVGLMICLALAMMSDFSVEYNAILSFYMISGPILLILFFSLKKNYCSSCDKAVHKDAINNTLKREITAFSEGTDKVTSLNPALGFGASGKGGVMGIGATTSTSHIPIKLARYQCSVKCPECHYTYHWNQNIKVRIWTSPEGVESIEDLEPMSYPFKMV